MTHPQDDLIRRLEGARTTTAAARRGDLAGDPGAVLAAHPAGEWCAVALPHNYADGTTHRWAVLYRTKDNAVVELADWLTEDTARLIANAPKVLVAAQRALAIAESYIHDQLDGTKALDSALSSLDLVRTAIAASHPTEKE